MFNLKSEIVQELDSCQSLFLESIEGLPHMSLRIVVAEGVPRWPDNPERDFHPELAAMIRGSMALQPEGRSFEIVFDTYVSYTMLDESFGIYPEASEVFVGKRFREFSSSHLLEFMERTARIEMLFGKTMLHFQIACENHVVDVITTGEPKISRLT